jgi:hypothetical protein
MQPAYITTTGPAGRIQGTRVPSANVRAVNSKRWRESCRAVQERLHPSAHLTIAAGYGIHAPPPSSYHRLMPCCRDRRRQRELASYSRGGWPGWGCMARHDLHLNTLHCTARTHTHTTPRWIVSHHINRAIQRPGPAAVCVSWSYKYSCSLVVRRVQATHTDSSLCSSGGTSGTCAQGLAGCPPSVRPAPPPAA